MEGFVPPGKFSSYATALVDFPEFTIFFTSYSCLQGRPTYIRLQFFFQQSCHGGGLSSFLFYLAVKRCTKLAPDCRSRRTRNPGKDSCTFILQHHPSAAKLTNIARDWLDKFNENNPKLKKHPISLITPNVRNKNLSQTLVRSLLKPDSNDQT